MQIEVEIPDVLMAQLERVSVQSQRPQEELLKEAIDLYLVRNSSSKTADPSQAEGQNQHALQRSTPGVTPSPVTDPEERERIIREASGSLPHLGDGLVYQGRVRNEWVREWDPEYDPRVHG